MGRGKTKGNTEGLAALEYVAGVALAMAESEGWQKWETVYAESGAKTAQAVRLAKAAAALEAVAQVAGLGVFQANRRKKAMYGILGRLLSERGVRSIPNNWRVLSRKCDRALEGVSIAELIKPKNVGNQNAAKPPTKRAVKPCPKKRKTRARLDDSNTLTDPLKFKSTP